VGGFILFFGLLIIIVVILKLAKIDKGGVAARKDNLTARSRRGSDSHGGFFYGGDGGDGGDGGE